MKTESDISDTIVAKSDQLNSDDLIGGPITVTIRDVKRATSDDQPVAIHITGGHQPWKPCKTMRRVLVQAWGKDANQWKGRSLTLKRDPNVKWAGEAVGGIRIHAMSHITSRLELSLTETRGHKRKCVIERLETVVDKYAAKIATLSTPEAINEAQSRTTEAKDLTDADRAEIGRLFEQQREKITKDKA